MLQLVALMVGAQAGSGIVDCSPAGNNNVTFAKSIATTCLGHGSDPEQCTAIGTELGDDACTNGATWGNNTTPTQQLCPAMCHRCPIATELVVIFVLMWLATIASLVFLWRRGWHHFETATHELLSSADVEGGIIRRSKLLLCTRGFTFCWTFTLMLKQLLLGEAEHWSYVYFTIWNYTTLVVVFGLLLAHSLSAHGLGFRSLPRWLTCTTWTLFQVELTNALMLDAIFWMLLYDGCGVEWTMVNVHGINAIFIFTEFYLNQIVLRRGQVIWVVLYAMVYASVNWMLYLDGYPAPYPFLRVGPSSAPLWYIGLIVGVILVYFGLVGLSVLKRKYVLKAAGFAYMSLDSAVSTNGSVQAKSSDGWE